MKTRHAKVHFNEQGTPIADDFDDVYFSNDSGIDETLHVFIAGNDLPQRWLEHNQKHFVIAETGLGTGLNCLVAMQAFAHFRQQNPTHVLKQLFILTTEMFPLTREDLKQALARFEPLSEAAGLLAEQYPVNLDGCHRLCFDRYSTVLDIWLGDVHSLLGQWHCPADGLVDAWFLDGFAPSKNPQMWTAALFSQMARLTRTGGTLATFTVAGVVKRGLREAGFTISKRPGFGRKRDMLSGVYLHDKHSDSKAFPIENPYYRYTQSALQPTQQVAIVGGGLAGATMALALTRRGLNVTLITPKAELADGASGNPQGGYYPQLHAQPSRPSNIQAHSFLFARRYYQEILDQGATFAHDWCGVLLLDFNANVAARHQSLLHNGAWPSELISGVSQTQASTIAGLPVPTGALYCKSGGWLSPPELVQAMVTLASREGRLTVMHDTRVTAISQANEHEQTGRANHVTLTTNKGVIQVDHAILCTGADSHHLGLERFLPLRAVRGQVESIKSTGALRSLQTVLCHKGYLTPAWHGRHAMGSTYVKGDTDTAVRPSESTQNQQLHQLTLAHADWHHLLRSDGTARAAIRLGLPDHLPAAGALPLPLDDCARWHALSKGVGLSKVPKPPAQAVHVLTGLGSRGLTTAPLMAEILASQLCGEPLPMANELLNSVNPQRFVVRQCIRSESSA